MGEAINYGCMIDKLVEKYLMVVSGMCYVGIVLLFKVMADSERRRRLK